jgi:hypothetical protein
MSAAENYQNKIHRLGKITATLFFLCTLILPLSLWLKFDLLPTASGFFSGLASVWLFMFPANLAEFLSFAPAVGAGAYYVMMSSGNFSNIRIPCAIVALVASKLDSSTEEGDLISTIAVATSVIVTEIILIAGVLLLAPFTELLSNPVLEPGIKQILPSLFAALLTSFAFKSVRVSMIPVLTALCIVTPVVFLVAKSGALIPLLIPVVILISVLIARWLYKKGYYQPS